MTSRIIIQQGAAVLENDPKHLFDIQEEILSASLNFDSLSEPSKDVLSILSWVPQLDSEMLRDATVGDEIERRVEFSNTLSDLERSCLIQSSGPNYSIAAPIRSLFRRKHGYGSDALRASFAGVLKARWDAASANDELRAELFDALLFMAALEGNTLDPAFRDLVSPATLQAIVRSTYDNRGRDELPLERVINWGTPARDMRMDETVREEILSYVVRAMCRLGRKAPAEELLTMFEQRQYRSRFYLKSFCIRHNGGSLLDAIGLLKKAYEVRKYMGSVVADLALCYQKLAMWTELKDLLAKESNYIDRNAGLLDVQIGFLIGSKRFPEAEIAIRKLSGLPREDGRAQSRSAMLLMHRDQDYAGAQRLMTESLQTGRGGLVPTRRLRGIAAAYAGDAATARGDIDFLKGRPGGADAAHRIDAGLKLTLKDHTAALVALTKVQNWTHQDGLLKARILDAKMKDVATPLAERPALQQEAEALRKRYGLVSEYEADI